MSNNGLRSWVLFLAFSLDCWGLVSLSSCSQSTTHSTQLESTEIMLATEQQEPPMECYEKTIFISNAAYEPYSCSAPIPLEPTTPNPKIRLLGLDAVGWPVLNELLRTDEAPGFKRLICSGASAVFKTDVGCTPISCTTITSGKERSKHGILTDDVTGHSPFEYSWRAVKVARLWHMLAYHNLSVLTGGFLLADEHDTRLTTIEELRRLQHQENYQAIITFYDQTDSIQHQYLMPFLLEHTDWGRAHVIEEFWQGCGSKAVERFTRTFSEVDSLITELLTRYPQDILIVFSDHGQSPTAPKIRFKPNLPILLPNHRVTELRSETWVIDEAVQVTVEYRERKYRYAEKQPAKMTIRGYLLLPMLSFTLAQAGNEPLLSALMQELSTISLDGCKLFDLEHNQTLVLREHCLRDLLLGNQESLALDPIWYSGEHGAREHGIFIAYGQPFRSGVVTNPISLVDLTPIALYALGLPVARDMDGRVVEDLFQPEFLADHTLTYIDSYDAVVELAAAPGMRRELTQEEINLYKQRGYPGLP